jgi:S-DNA-T family DNA segregation ATPase FtsK/SpoIIIE
MGVSRRALAGTALAAGAWAWQRAGRRPSGLPAVVPHPGPRSKPGEIALGVTGAGKQVVWCLHCSPHLLVAGRNGGGKSMLLRSVLRHALAHPVDWRIEVIDLKRVDWSWLAGASTVGEIATDRPAAAGLLARVHAEMDRRYALMDAERVASFDRLVDPLPRMLVVVDEVAALDPPDWDRTGWVQHLDAVARAGRAAGIHLAVSTCLSATDRLTPTVRNNATFRVLFGGASEYASTLILGDDVAVFQTYVTPARRSCS